MSVASQLTVNREELLKLGDKPMATSTQLKRTSEEVVKLGDEILKRRVEPLLNVGDTGKYVAIAVDNGEFEVDEDDYTAVSRLRARFPQAEVFLGRAGHDATYQFRWTR